MNKQFPIIFGFLILAIFIWLQVSSISPIRNMIMRLDNLSYDLQLRTRLLTHKKLPDSFAVVVDIDDKSLQKVGQWPWPRSKVATLVNEIQQAGAVVVGFDTLFSEKEENIVDTISEQLKNKNLETKTLMPVLEKIRSAFDYDAIFAESLKNIDSVLGITFLPRTYTVGNKPKPLLVIDTKEENDLGLITSAGYLVDIGIIQNAAKSEGFLNVFPDADGVIRRVPLLMRYENGIYPSLALEAVRLFLLSKVDVITAKYGDTEQIEGVKVGNHIIPTDPHAQVIIPFVGKSYTIPFFSASDVLEKKYSSGPLQGKIVFLGTSATGLGDIHATAVESVYPGVEIHATVANGILSDTFSFKPAWAVGAEISITILIGLICVFIFPFLGPRTLGLLILIIPTAMFLINNEVWEKTGLIISILIPTALPIILAFLNIIYGYLFETLRREKLKGMFGQYVPEEHIDEMLKSKGGSYGLLGDDRDMTVLFADIRNFTSISEPLSATELKNLLNEFFTPMTEIIFKHQGTIDKYVGDLIMAFWGAPLKDKKHAQHALAAAIEMQIMVTKLHTEFAKRNWPEINIGIGLNSGEMSVGDMGSKFRRNYTVLGDAVNLASRIESLSKFYGVKIITTENTQRDQPLFVFRKLDKVRVKGKQTGIEIYEVICKQKDLTKSKEEEIKLSNQALDYYYHQQWNLAEQLFQKLNTEHPDVVLYSLYLKRINEFKTNPPAENWDGVYIHTEK